MHPATIRRSGRWDRTSMRDSDNQVPRVPGRDFGHSEVTAAVGRACPTFRIRRVSVPSEVDLGAHAKNHGVVGLHARRVIAAPTGIDDILSVELEVQPAGRLPSVPDFKRHFVAAGVRTEGSRVHVRRAGREADFLLGTPGEFSGMPEAEGDLVILVRRPVIGDGGIEEGVPTYRTGTVNG